jgi:CheY-like chemotaxis protein
MFATLLVDDSLNFRSALQEALRSRFPFCHVAGAESIRRALAEVRTLMPDLVITDLMLPDGSGLDLIGRLRRIGVMAPIVMTTIHDLPEYREAAARCGADKFFAKLTMTLQDLVEYIDGVLAGRLRVLAVCTVPTVGRALEVLFARRWPDVLSVHAASLEEGVRAASALKPNIVLFQAGDDQYREQLYSRTLRARCGAASTRLVCVRQRVAAGVPPGADFAFVAGRSLEEELAHVVELARAERCARPLVA